MCGIVGYYGSGNQHDNISEALSAISHRGPDDKGIFQDGPVSLAHARLSIIDLSSLGRQPMKDEATGVVIVFNGEIYNYLELRAKLAGESFIGYSDTEVILKQYLKSGISCVSKLRGMFAFAIWDPRIDTIFLCRDRFGIKPLYYCQDGLSLLFSSEIKGILAFGIPAHLNLRVVSDYLRHGLTAHNNETFFAGIHSFPAGTVGTYCQGKLTFSTYWFLDDLNQNCGNGSDIEKEVQHLLKEALQQHLISDVPVAVSLSSGLDSQCITYLLSQVGDGEYQTFTYGFKETEYDEIIRVQQRNFPTSFKQHFLQMNPDEMLGKIQQAIHYFEIPLGGLGTLGQFSLMELVKKHGIKVVLTGEGSDEIFGGYKYYYHAYFRDLYEKKQIQLLQHELQEYSRTNNESLKMDSKEFRDIVLTDTSSVRAPDGSTLGGSGYISQIFEKQMAAGSNWKAPEFPGHSHLRQAMLRDLFSLKLPKLLWFQDRASMAWGIETRVPFLDHKIAEFVYRCPPDWIIRDGISKYIPKRLFKRFYHVDYTSSVKHYVATPQREWLKGPLFDDIMQYLDGGYFSQSGLVNYPAWQNAYREYAASRELGNSFFIWKMVNMEALLQEFFPQMQYNSILSAVSFANAKPEY